MAEPFCYAAAVLGSAAFFAASTTNWVIFSNARDSIWRTRSRLMERPVRRADAVGTLSAAPEPTRWAVAVAAFGFFAVLILERLALML